MWIVTDGLPFKLIKFFLFHKFLSLASFIINEILFKFDNIICRNLCRVIDFCYLDIVRALANAHLKIYLIVNIWSFLNTYVIFGVKCRFID